MNTRPNASIRIAWRCMKNSRFEMRQPSANSSGGMKSNTKSSGSKLTCRPNPGHARQAPIAIWISGKGSVNGNAEGSALMPKPDSTTASNRIRTVKTISMIVGFLVGLDGGNELAVVVGESTCTRMATTGAKFILDVSKLKYPGLHCDGAARTFSHEHAACLGASCGKSAANMRRRVRTELALSSPTGHTDSRFKITRAVYEIRMDGGK